MTLQLPTQVMQILNTLEAAGFEGYAVGGCVRDSLLGRRPQDWDVTTSALPEQVSACFADCRVIETGLQHGTVTVVMDGERFEITTYRVDGAYSDSRHPDGVRFVRNLREDLARRDFTINAMAYSPTRGLADYFGGKTDLEKGLIRAVGNPDIRFGEDALRILRALRFAAVYQFHIADETAASLHRNRENLQKIAIERITAEFSKLLVGKGAVEQLLQFADVIAVFLPEIVPMFGFQQHNPHYNSDVWEHTLRALAEGTDDLAVNLAILLHDIGKPHCYTRDAQGIGHFYGHGKFSTEIAGELLHRLRYDSATISQVRKLVSYHDAELSAENRQILRLLNNLGEPLFRKLLLVKRADTLAQAPVYQAENLERLRLAGCKLEAILAERQCFCLKDLAVDGRSLLALGVPAGKQIGECLQGLLNRVLDGTLENERGALELEIKAFLNRTKA